MINKVGDKMKYGDDWDARSTAINEAGIVIAPEIFVAPERLYLPTGRVIMKGTKYFTWATAQELVTNGLTPRDWRLPTADESAKIAKRYSRRGFGILVIGLDGTINPNDMPMYNYNIAQEKSLVNNKGSIGYYWTSELEAPLYAHTIVNSGMNIRSDLSSYVMYGLPMLLVKSI